MIMPVDPHVLNPQHLPTPFTADEIRDGCPAGRVIHLVVEDGDEKPYRRVNRFLSTDADGADQDAMIVDGDGAPLGAVRVFRTTWKELQGHASFPAADTTIDEETIETPLGRLDCLRYATSEGATEHVFWFARNRPGMPVKYMTLQRGTPMSVSTVVSDTVDESIVARPV
jgi:hypothetical protein